MRDPRGPWDVPDEPDAWHRSVADGVDTDGDGVPDTTVVDDGFDLVVATDLDGDGLADQVLRVAADGGVREIERANDTADSGPDTPGWSPVHQ